MPSPDYLDGIVVDVIGEVGARLAANPAPEGINVR